MKRLVLLSGGLDSSTVLAWVKSISLAGDEVAALSFEYGSKHNESEWAAAQRVAEFFRIPVERIHLDFVAKLFKSDLLKSGGDVPEGHYAADNMKATVVPFRNGIMLAIAAGYAESRGFREIYLANHAGDHTIYPDCRPEFSAAMAKAVESGTWDGIRFIAPFQTISKASICAIGVGLGAPLDLSWSCYKGGAVHCGVCGTCHERREAFQLAGYEDPTEYLETPPLPVLESAAKELGV